MAEYIAPATQTVAAGSNVLFTDTVVSGPCSVYHRPDSGLVTLRGMTKQARARFKVSFNGNIAIPTGSTAGALSFAIATGGEAMQSTTMTVTPADVEEYFNISSSVFLDVPAGCCSLISVKNTSTIPALIENANLMVERVA